MHITIRQDGIKPFPRIKRTENDMYEYDTDIYYRIIGNKLSGTSLLDRMRPYHCPAQTKYKGLHAVY